MTKERRRGKVFIDWSEDTPHKTTVAPFSLRARAAGRRRAADLDRGRDRGGGDGELRVEAGQALERMDERSRISAPLLDRHQELPDPGER